MPVHSNKGFMILRPRTDIRSSSSTYNVSDGGNYSFGNPDFNFRQFRSNLVVRWEYLPGSTFTLCGHRAEQALIQTVCFLMETI